MVLKLKPHKILYKYEAVFKADQSVATCGVLARSEAGLKGYSTVFTTGSFGILLESLKSRIYFYKNQSVATSSI